jgi:hypothetical protein
VNVALRVEDFLGFVAQVLHFAFLDDLTLVERLQMTVHGVHDIPLSLSLFSIVGQLIPTFFFNLIFKKKSRATLLTE